MRSVLSMSTTMGKDIHVVSMDVETIAVIKKNKKIQHERMRQGNARIIVIHPFVLFDKMADYIFNMAIKTCECDIDLYMD